MNSPIIDSFSHFKKTEIIFFLIIFFILKHTLFKNWSENGPKKWVRNWAPKMSPKLRQKRPKNWTERNGSKIELKIATEMAQEMDRKTCQKHENLCKYTYKNSITHSLLFTRKMLRFRIFFALKNMNLKAMVSVG